MSGAIPTYAFNAITGKILLLLCANYIKWMLQLPYFSFSLLPKAPLFVPAAAREISGKRPSPWRWRKAAEFGINYVTWLYMASGNTVFAGMA